MIADWTVEVSPESPIIVLPWEGWADLRPAPHSASQSTPDVARVAASLSEVAQYPELLPILLSANGEFTLTSKVDVFAVSRDDVDPEIAEAGLEATAFGLCSYTDLLTPHTDVFGSFGDYEALARSAAAELAQFDEPGVAIEIVIRPAQLYDSQTFGWTLYVSGFGPDPAAATARWAGASTLAMATCVKQVETRVRSEQLASGR